MHRHRVITDTDNEESSRASHSPVPSVMSDEADESNHGERSPDVDDAAFNASRNEAGIDYELEDQSKTSTHWWKAMTALQTMTTSESVPLWGVLALAAASTIGCVVHLAVILHATTSRLHIALA